MPMAVHPRQCRSRCDERASDDSSRLARRLRASRRASPEFLEDASLSRLLHAGRESPALRTCPHLRTIAIKPDGCIQRFHRAVSKIWELVFGNYPIGGGDAIHRLLVATGDRDVAGSASKFLILRPQLLTIGTFDSREIPFDFQEVTRLLRRPELVGNNGYRGSFTDRGDLKYICHAGNAPCFLVVDRFRRCAEGWWMRHQRNLHSGQIEV